MAVPHCRLAAGDGFWHKASPPAEARMLEHDCAQGKTSGSEAKNTLHPDVMERALTAA
jgi:hypothetical protein